MDYKKLRELQMMQYGMLKEVVKLCEKHNIEYYLMYGTLLGAVRHKASIPWDYDIDIAMTRENHTKFLSVVKELADELRVEHICYSTIQYASLSRVEKQIENGKWTHIDIFILDYAKIYPKCLSVMAGAMGRFLQIAKLSKEEKAILYKRFNEQKKKLLIVYIGELLRHILGSERIEKWNYKLLVSQKKTKKYVIIEEPHKLLEVDYFRNKESLKYEDAYFTVSADYKKLLEKWYGNYMEIPEEGKRYEEYCRKQNNLN